MIHPLATTTPCNFAVVSLAAKEKINKYMERNLLWICKHWFVRSPGFLFNCSAYTSTYTHTHTHKAGVRVHGRKTRWQVPPECSLLSGIHIQSYLACLSTSILFISFLFIHRSREFPTFWAWFWFLPFSLSYIVFIRNFPPLCQAELIPFRPLSAQGCGKERESPWQPENGLTVSLGNTSSLCVFWSLSPASTVPEEAQLGERLTSFLARAACPWGFPSPSLSK